MAPYFARRIQLAIFIIAIGFGLDYLVTPAGSSAALTTIERTWVPLWSWGLTILTCGVSGLFVELHVLNDDHPLLLTEKRWKWGWISNIAHTILFALFVALAGSSLYDTATRLVAEHGADAGKLYGWRTALMWGGYAYANWLFIPRMGRLR